MNTRRVTSPDEQRAQRGDVDGPAGRSPVRGHEAQHLGDGVLALDLAHDPECTAPVPGVAAAGGRAAQSELEGDALVGERHRRKGGGHVLDPLVVHAAEEVDVCAGKRRDGRIRTRARRPRRDRGGRRRRRDRGRRRRFRRRRRRCRRRSGRGRRRGSRRKNRGRPGGRLRRRRFTLRPRHRQSLPASGTTSEEQRQGRYSRGSEHADLRRVTLTSRKMFPFFGRALRLAGDPNNSSNGGVRDSRVTPLYCRRPSVFRKLRMRTP